MAAELTCDHMHWVFRMKNIKTCSRDCIVGLTDCHRTSVNTHRFNNGFVDCHVPTGHAGSSHSYCIFCSSGFRVAPRVQPNVPPLDLSSPYVNLSSVRIHYVSYIRKMARPR